MAARSSGGKRKAEPEPEATAAPALRDVLVERAVSAQKAQAADEVNRIVEATYRVMAAEGSVEPRVRDILLEAGVSTQAFYRHFASKDELLLVIMDDGLRQLADYLQLRMARVAADGPEAEVRAWLLGMLAQAANPEASRRTRPFINGIRRLGDLHPAEQRGAIDRLVDILAGALERGVEAGVFAEGDVRQRAGYVYRLGVGVMEDHILEGTTPSKAENEALISFCLGALRA
jgi:AcrR family transcriptional regulator